MSPEKGSLSICRQRKKKIIPSLAGDPVGPFSLPVCERLAKQVGDSQAVATVLHRALPWYISHTCCRSRNFGLQGSEKD